MKKRVLVDHDQMIQENEKKGNPLPEISFFLTASLHLGPKSLIIYAAVVIFWLITVR